MDQDKTLHSTENHTDSIPAHTEDRGGAHESHSHHGSGSHHGRHHSSHHSKRKHKRSHKQPLLVRMQNWIDKKFSPKVMLIMVLVTVLVVGFLVGSIFFFENRKPNTPVLNGEQGGYVSGDVNTSTNTATMNVAIPSYWEKMVAEKTKTVKALQTTGGADCVSFAWASDTHIPDNDTTRTNDLGKVMAKMMDNCQIPFAVLTGDIGTRSSYDTETEFVHTQESIPQHLAPLWGTDRLLVALGNHDGCYGDASGYYKKQFTPERLWQIYFRGQALDPRREFSEDGLYFYVDNKAQKTRFIILNSQFGGEYLADGNGWAVNDRFDTSCYGQEQLDWLANEALDMPEGYSAVIAAHVPPNELYYGEAYTVDHAQLCGIINAYNNKTTFKGSYTAGVDGWSNSKVNVDFTRAKGEIIAMFTGHIHQDTVDTTTLSCPLITIISAGASVNFGEAPSRTAGTDTETSFDVVTINKKTRTIYCTRVGAGQDRVIQY